MLDRNKKINLVNSGFTLIELLVVISIIGILLGLSVFGLQGARQSSRDARRKADLESIRSGLEIYKADCDGYPAALGASLVGVGAVGTSCSSSNTYISKVPLDPNPTVNKYAYTTDALAVHTTYILCATLEQVPSPLGDTTGCGSCKIDAAAVACNYKVKNP